MTRENNILRRNLIAGFAIALCILGLVATISLLSVRAKPTTGVVKTTNLGIYSDSACTQNLTSVSWGTVSPGSTITRMIYIKNLGNYMEKLSLSTTNWYPATANRMMTLSWNMERARVAPGQVVAATVTLVMTSGAGGWDTFGVDLVITGSGNGRQF